jgi:hypothetical protein
VKLLPGRKWDTSAEQYFIFRLHINVESAFNIMPEENMNEGAQALNRKFSSAVKIRELRHSE